jgi:hypothetical protein
MEFHCAGKRLRETGNRRRASRLVVDMIGRFVHALAAALLGLGVAAGCDSDESTPTPGPSPSASGAGCARPAVGTADAAATFTPGPTKGMPASTAKGEALAVDAVVLDRACQPAAGAELRIWHTDARGLYGPEGGDECCYYEARGRTDHSGRFRLETIRPAQYPQANAPPAHIHMEIRHAGGRTEVLLLFGLNSPPATVLPATVPVTIPLHRDGAGWRGEAAMMLA